MRVFLMGMPGSGKSTSGKKLAKALSLPFFDLDQFIEQKYEKKIAELFAAEGEDFFRNAERECLLELIEKNGACLISLGGGTPCFFDNLQRINSAGISVYLEMTVAALVKRIESGAGERPMFSGMNAEQIAAKLTALLETRANFYEKAHIKINGINLDVPQLAQLVKQHHEEN